MFARTPRLLLRPPWADDAAELHAQINDAAIVRNLAHAPWPYGLDDAHDFVARDQDFFVPHFLMVRRAANGPQIIGSVGLGRDPDGAVEIGYWLGRAFWGQGFAVEGARAVLGIARMLGHRRISAGHFTDNPASGAVLRKLGFAETGREVPRFSRGRGQAAPCRMFALDMSPDNSADAEEPEMTRPGMLAA